MNKKEMFIMLVQTGAIIRGRDACGDAIAAVRKAADVPKASIPEEVDRAAIEFLAWHFNDIKNAPEWLRPAGPSLVRGEVS